jgi:glycerol-3-phosphate dehydrogenase
VGGGRDSDLSTLTRDYSFEIDHADGRAALLTVFGGKLTTHRKMAEQAVGKLAPYLNLESPSRTATESCPAATSAARASRNLRCRCCAPIPDFPPLKSGAARLYGTRARIGLPAPFARRSRPRPGADLHEREADF